MRALLQNLRAKSVKKGKPYINKLGGVNEINMRVSIRRLAFIVIIMAAFVMIYYAVNDLDIDPYSPQHYPEHDERTRKLIHYGNLRLKHEDNYLSNHKLQKLKSLESKCVDFFQNFLETNKKWQFQQFVDKPHNKDIDKFEKYFKNQLMKLAKELYLADPKEALNRESKERIIKKWNNDVTKTINTESEMAQSISLLRIYNKCFIENNSESYENNQHLDNTLFHKFFPYLSGKTPQFEIMHGYNESTILEDSLPDFSNNQFVGNYVNNTGGNLLKFYKNNISGRGILLTVTSRHSKEAAKLIRVLRALNNELPIQVIFRGSLSKKSRQIIMTAALHELEDVLKFSTGYKNILPEIDLVSDSQKFNIKYPKQSITFVNMKGVINSTRLFPGFLNKVISYVFSSFSEVMLLDTDTVPLVELVKLFESQQYKETSTFFFKDRTLRDTNDYMETNFFHKLLPHGSKLETSFGITPVNNDLLKDNAYFRGYRHYQESGVVLLNKKDHFSSLLMILPLGYWKEPVKSSVWGDKEFYWLSLLMAGDQKFAFNEFYAGSIGEATTNSSLQLYDVDVHEVCSSHPGHINEKGELLWINSGFSYCKKNGYFRDREKFPFDNYDMNTLKRIYENPLKITHGIVPPTLPLFRGDNNDLERSWKLKWKSRKKDQDEKSNNSPQRFDYQPQKGWVKSEICSNYNYCAYDKIESYFDSNSFDEGHFFAFNESCILKYDYLGKLWITTNSNIFEP